MLKRIPWFALIASVAVVLSSAFAVAPIRDAATLGDVAEASLMRPLSYVMLAPMSDTLDMLTLLSARQHVAMVCGVVVLFAGWRALSSWRSRQTRRRHLSWAAVLFAAIVVTYAAVAVLPRPMATLVTDNANIVRVDLHSHTAASHDGRPGWTPERNREWHRAGGYDVAYITDHGVITGAEQGYARNPAPAGEGVTLLQGIEVTWTGEHVAILGAQRAYKGILTENLRDVDVQGLRLASLIPNREPVVIWNHPHHLDRLPIAKGPGTPGVRAIELSNGAPDSRDEVGRKRAEIVALAERNNLTLTGGSDNHGWGSTAPNWTLMLILGWRGLAGDALAAQIEIVVRRNGVGGARVVERRVADGSSRLWLSATSITAPARMLTTLSNDERISWLIWIWVLTAIRWWARRRRTSPS